MVAREVLIDYLSGKHTSSQIHNYIKYIIGMRKRACIVNWQPIHLSIFLTYRCNLNCDFCLTHSRKFTNPYGQKPTEDMDFDYYKYILTCFSNAFTVNLIGNGEPLLHKDLFKMIKFASHQTKMNVVLSTNGILVDKYLKELVDSPLKYINISINGYNRYEFNRMTGMSAELFDLIYDNLSKLVQQRNAKKRKFKVATSFILDQTNYLHLEDMANIGNDLGADTIYFFQFLPVPQKGFTALERCLFSDEIDVLEAFSNIKSLPKNLRKKIVLPPLLDKNMKNNKYCSTPFFNLSIDGSGNLGGCSCQLLDLSRMGRFSDATSWNSKHFVDLRNKFIDINQPIPDPCTWCYNNVPFKSDWLKCYRSNRNR